MSSISSHNPHPHPHPHPQAVAVVVVVVVVINVVSASFELSFAWHATGFGQDARPSPVYAAF